MTDIAAKLTAETIDPDPSGRRRKIFLVGFVLSLAAALRFLGLNQTLLIDEAGSLALSSAPDFWASARQDVHPPLYYGILRIGLKFTSSFVTLRLFSVACGLALVAGMLLLLRKSTTAMLIAGMALGALPPFIFHSQQLRPYALLFLLLAIALACAVRIFEGANDARTKIALALVLLVAAATHLITAFFLVALTPLLFWPVRRDWRRLSYAMLPLCPAGLLLLGFKFGFVNQPRHLAEGWWMPPVSTRVVLETLRDAIGWDEVQWFADACARRMVWAGQAVEFTAGSAIVLACWIAWGRRGNALSWVLLVSSLLYGAALVVYSHFFESLVIARTLLPSVLTFVAGLAWGIGTNPSGWRRTSATIAVMVYLSLSAAPVIRRAFSPMAGLRGLAAVAQNEYRPGDAVILFRAMDYGLAPYWPDFSGSAPLRIDQTQPPAPQFLELDQRLGKLDGNARVFLAYRDDFYLQQHRDVLDAVLRQLAASGHPARIFWRENDLTLLRSEPTLRP